MTTYEQQPDDPLRHALREADSLFGGKGRLQKTYDRLSARLAELNITHVLVGGFALILHRVRRFTEDIDVLITRSDLPLLRDRLIGAGYLSIPGCERSIQDAETNIRIDFVSSGGFPGDGQPKPVCFPEPASVTDPAFSIPVITLHGLIELKLASGMTAPDRLQDLADVQRLIAEHRLDSSFAARLDPYVRPKFLELVESMKK